MRYKKTMVLSNSREIRWPIEFRVAFSTFFTFAYAVMFFGVMWPGSNFGPNMHKGSEQIPEVIVQGWKVVLTIIFSSLVIWMWRRLVFSKQDSTKPE